MLSLLLINYCLTIKTYIMLNTLLTSADKKYLQDKWGYTSTFLENKTYNQLLNEIKDILKNIPECRVEKGGSFNRPIHTLYFDDPQLLAESIQTAIIKYCIFITKQSNYLPALKKAGVIQTPDNVDSSLFY